MDGIACKNYTLHKKIMVSRICNLDSCTQLQCYYFTDDIEDRFVHYINILHSPLQNECVVFMGFFYDKFFLNEAVNWV